MCRVTDHQVRLIDQDDLPVGTEWALVEVDGRVVVFLTPAALTEAGLSEAWAAYRLLASAPVPPRPRHLLLQVV